MRRAPTLLGAWTAAVYAFVMAPIVVVLLASLTAAEYTSFPPEGLSLRWYLAIPEHPEFLESFRISLVVALVTGAVATALGTPAALVLVRHRFRGRDALNAFFLSPLMLPAVVLGIALLQFYTLVGLTRTPLALVFGHLIITITLPLVRPGVVAGATFAVIVSFDDVSVALFLAGPHSTTLPVRIFSYIEQTFDPLATAVCSVLILIALAAVLVIERSIGLGRMFGEETTHD
ncbi:MAG: ABC transporter permease [Candidatus Rokubacteria bacterium]|nr:ABC transporter permease [Candidatus Rokubacteria bacterium]